MLLPSPGTGLQDTEGQQLSGSPAGLLQAGIVEEGDGDGNGFSFNTHWLQTQVPLWCDTAWADTRDYFAAIAKLLQPTLVFPSGLLSLPSPLQPAHVSISTTERNIYSTPSPPGTLQRDTHKLWCL